MAGNFKNTNCDKLWRVWYALLIGALQIFLIYVGINRYLAFKSQAFDAKYGGEWNQTGLNFTLAMLISAMTFFSLFIIVSLLRTDNYANEGTQIGRDTDNLQILTPATAPSMSASAWRSQIPPPLYVGMNGSQPPSHLLRNGNSGQLGATLQRSSFSPLAEADDRMSTDPVVGEDGVHAGNFDTWSARSNAIVGGNGGLNGISPDMMLFNSYNQGNLLRANGGAMESPTRTHATVKQSVGLLWRRLQRHCLPYSDFLHVLTAICLLLPIAVVHAQQIYHRVVPFDWIWRSDLDFLVGSENPTHNTADSSLFMAGSLTDKSPTSNKQRGASGGSPISNSEPITVPRPGWDELRAISPEYFNLCLALLLLSLHYPSVFWYTNRSFAFVFSLLLLLVGAYILIEYNAVFVLVKIAWNQYLVASTGHSTLGGQSPNAASLTFVSVPLHTSQQAQQIHSMSNQKLNGNDLSAVGSLPTSPTASGGGMVNITPLILSTIGSLIFLCLFITVFEYGYRQFIDSLSAHRHYLMASVNERTELLPPSNSILMTQHQQQQQQQQQQQGDSMLLDSQHPQAHQGYNTIETMERLTSPQHLHRNPPPESLESLVNGSTKSNNYGSAVGVLPTAPGLGNGGVGTAGGNNNHDNGGEEHSHWFAYNIGAEILHPYCRFCLYACAPRIIALIGCLVVVAFKIPVVIDCLRVYRVTKQTVMLLTPLSCGIAVCAWLIAWFAFSLKPAWKFQVNLPTQAVNTNTPTMASYRLPCPTAGLYPTPVPVNCFQPPMLSGGMLHSPPGVLYNGGMPLSGTMTGSQPIGVLSPPQNLFVNHPDELDGGRRGVSMVMTSGSPVYACFHEAPATVAAAGLRAGTSSVAGLIDPSTGLPAVSAVVSGVFSGLAGNGTGLYPLEYCSEGTEASSGRHSGNNYVCLQSAMHSNAHVGMATSPSFNTTADSHQQQQQQQATSMLLLNRSLLRSAMTSTATTSAVPMTTSTNATTGCSTQPLLQLSRSSAAVGEGGQLMESNKAVGVPYGTASRLDPFQQREPEVDKDESLTDIGSNDDGLFSGVSMHRSPYLADLNYSHGNSLGHCLSTVKPTVSGLTALGFGVGSHRMVSFHEEPIGTAGGSEPSVKPPKISSGTTVIANGLLASPVTPSTFRSTMVFRSPSLNTTNLTHNQDHPASTATNFLAVNPPSHGSCFYSRSGIATTPSLVNGKPETGQDSGMSQPASDAHPVGATAMIGDTNNSVLQMSSDGDDERYPLLLPPSLLTGDPQEPRLCSQV